MFKKITNVEDFTVFPNTEGQTTLVAQLQIPQNTIWLTCPALPMKVKVGVTQQFTSVAANAAFSLTPTEPISPLINNSSGEPYYTLIAHAYDITANKDLGSPTSINYSTNAMTFAGNSGAGTADTIQLFYLTSQGNVAIYREAGGANTQRYLMFSGSLAQINVSNPYDLNVADFWETQYPLLPLDKLLVYVNTPAQVAITSDAALGSTIATTAGNVSVTKLDMPFQVYQGENDIIRLAIAAGVIRG